MTMGAILALTMAPGSWSCAEVSPSPPSLPSCPETLGDASSQRATILLTMLPGDRMWNIFGHTGLLVREPDGTQMVYDFGAVRGRAGAKLLRDFLVGTIDYYLRVRTLPLALSFYQREDRRVLAQVLDLPDIAHEKIADTLRRGAAGDGSDYSYHWVQTNCATQIRDLLDDVTGGQLRPQFQTLTERTARDEVLRHLGPDPVVWYSWHFAVSSSADRPLDEWSLMFMPETFFRLMERARVDVSESGRSAPQPLVATQCTLSPSQRPWPASSPPSRDLTLWLIGLALAALLSALARAGRRHWAGRFGFGLTFGVIGLGGAALGGTSVWLWHASTLAGFHGSLNLLVANPLTGLVGPAAAAAMISPGAVSTLGLNLVRGLTLVAGSALIVAPFVDQPILGPVGLFLPPMVAACLCLPRLTVAARRLGEPIRL